MVQRAESASALNVDSYRVLDCINLTSELSHNSALHFTSFALDKLESQVVFKILRKKIDFTGSDWG